MTTKQYTRSGTRRAGDDYQDIVGLELAVEWLEHPDRYQSVRFEADDAGALDDVTARTSSGKRILKQVKFSTNPEGDGDEWTWERLLRQDVGRQGQVLPSLLQKWAYSLQQCEADAAIEDALLVTNRRVTQEIALLMTDSNRINFDSIIDQSTRQQIEQQFDSEEKARHFFEIFRFEVDRPDLHIYEEAVHRRFLLIGGTEHGWVNLKNEIRSWTGRKDKPDPDGIITLAHIKSAAQWYRLKSLSQNFGKPTAYVLPDRAFYKQFVRNLLTMRRGCHVLFAPPGVGKSAYTNFLYSRLRRLGVPVIRHHYYLAQNDERTQSFRLDHLRAAESLMNDLKSEYSESLGGLDNQNAGPNELGKWIEACGQYFSQQAKVLIVIVDGLDHVWRERNSIDELELLLRHLLPTPDGVVVLLATQPVDDAILPPSLRHAAPRLGDAWTELPLLDLGAVRRWMTHHENDLTLFDGQSSVSEHYLVQIAEALFLRSGGHPLHLAYSMKALQEQRMPATPDNIARLPGVAHSGVKQYYETLFETLPEAGREVLFLLTACRFSWPRQSIVDCLSCATIPEPTVREALRQVAHLLVEDDLGLRPSHSSFYAFVSLLPDFQERAKRLRSRALEWLRERAPEQWRWGNEWLVHKSQGNFGPLIDGPTRTWAIEAIAKRRSWYEIDTILEEAVVTAFQRAETLPHAVRIGILHDYLARVFDDHRELTARLLPVQLFLNDDSYLRQRLLSDLSTLTNAEIGALGQAMAKRYEMRNVDRCLNLLQRRLRRAGMEPRSSLEHDWRDDLAPLFGIMAASPRPDVDRVVRNATIRQNIARDYVSLFAKAVRDHNNVDAMRDLLAVCASESRPIEEFGAVLEHAVLLAQEEELDIDAEVAKIDGIATADDAHFATALGIVYRVLRDMTPLATRVVLPDRARFKFGSMDKWYSPGKAERFVRDLFYCLLANHMIGAHSENDSWLTSVSNEHWAKIFAKKINHVTSDLAKRLKNGEHIGLAALYVPLAELEWPVDHSDAADFAEATERELAQIGLDLQALNAPSATPILTTDDLQATFAIPFVDSHRWMCVYASNQRPWLDRDAVQWLLIDQERRLTSEIGPFYERAERFTTLATIAALHELPIDAARLVRLAADNLLAHGYHKDRPIFASIDSAEHCHDAGFSTEARLYLQKLAPCVAAVREYTDGDGTRYLPQKMADALAKVAPDQLRTYYVWLAEREEYWHAEHALHAFLRTVDLYDPLNRAVASTAVDERSLEILAERLQADDTGAADAIAPLRTLLGQEGMVARKGQHRSLSGYDPLPDLPGADGAVHLPPIPADYPPTELSQFLALMKAARIDPREGSLDDWLSHWRAKGDGKTAYNALKEVVERGGSYGRYSDTLYRAALKLGGKREAYPWLVRGYAEEYGWSEFGFTPLAVAESIWEEVKDKYADRWFDFIRETFIGEHAPMTAGIAISFHQIERLVAFLIRLEQPAFAQAITEALVKSTLELISPIVFPPADWVDCVTTTADEEPGEN